MLSFNFGTFLPSCKCLTCRTEIETWTPTKRNKNKTHAMDMKLSEVLRGKQELKGQIKFSDKKWELKIC
jgi:hypothetical protein